VTCICIQVGEVTYTCKLVVAEIYIYTLVEEVNCICKQVVVEMNTCMAF